MAAISYYIFIYPLSLLPLPLMYVFSDLLYFIFRFVYPYRKKVVQTNLRRAFADKSKQEIKLLTKNFYRHFSDILIEGIKNLSITEHELRKRLVIKNPEIMDKLFRENKNVLLVSGHYNNWEWLITSQNFLLQHQAVGIGTPLSSKFWDKKLNERRSRFGMKVIDSKQAKTFFTHSFEKPIATLILSDQSPGDSNKAYWMNFLSRQTAVLFGCEMLAHTHDHAVVFFIIRKIKRGYYELEFETITEEPRTLRWGEITERHTRLLEKEIVLKPEFWMWSHKRWKRKVPDYIQALKTKQRTDFNERFKSY